MSDSDDFVIIMYECTFKYFDVFKILVPVLLINQNGRQYCAAGNKISLLIRLQLTVDTTTADVF
jgi:hypothetical protein